MGDPLPCYEHSEDETDYNHQGPKVGNACESIGAHEDMFLCYTLIVLLRFQGFHNTIGVHANSEVHVLALTLRVFNGISG